MRKSRRKNRFGKNKPQSFPAKFVEVKSKSQAGVEYTHYKLAVPNGAAGLNHLARRRQKARNRKRLS